MAGYKYPHSGADCADRRIPDDQCVLGAGGADDGADDAFLISSLR